MTMMTARTIGFVGNCQADLLQRLFQRATDGRPFRNFYHFYELDEAEQPKARADLAQCDVLFVQDIKNCEDYPLRDAIRAETRVLPFPFLWFAAPWPYDDFNGLRDGHARSQDDPALHTVTYYDGALGRLRKLVPDPEARVAAYRALDLSGLIKPERILDFEARRFEAQDQRYGHAIGRYILERFRDQPLFNTVNRPNGELLVMLFEQMLNALDIKLALPPLPELDELAVVQVPVHPKIGKALGVRWATDDRLYNFDGERLNWEAYVRAYIARYS
jgi:hypothetical protein